MKACLLPLLVATVAFAQSASDEPSQKTSLEPAAAQNIVGWGKAIDPQGDCKFTLEAGVLRLTVPGSNQPHDLSIELNSMTAPRVLQPVRGDFTVQVSVETSLEPGGESTQQGRTGYFGAGLFLYSSDQNYIRLDCAALQSGGDEPSPYFNFEMRSKGRLLRMGSTGDVELKPREKVFIRLQRKGDVISGAVSKDGENWEDLESMQLSEEWPEEIQVGVHAISTSRSEFEPRFSELKLKTEAEEKPKADGAKE